MIYACSNLDSEFWKSRLKLVGSYIPETQFSEILDLRNKLQLPFFIFHSLSSLNLVKRLDLVNERGLTTTFTKSGLICMTYYFAWKHKSPFFLLRIAFIFPEFTFFVFLPKKIIVDRFGLLLKIMILSLYYVSLCIMNPPFPLAYNFSLLPLYIFVSFPYLS